MRASQFEAASGGGSKPKRVTELTSGAGVYTPVSPRSTVSVTLVGGGGGGGATTLQNGLCGSGGSGAATVYGRLRLNGPISYEVGAGGTGASLTVAANAGGTTRLGPLVAVGGDPGVSGLSGTRASGAPVSSHTNTQTSGGGVAGGGGGIGGSNSTVDGGVASAGRGGQGAGFTYPNELGGLTNAETRAAAAGAGGAAGAAGAAAAGKRAGGGGGGGGSSTHGIGGAGGDGHAARTNEGAYVINPGANGAGYGAGGGGSSGAAWVPAGNFTGGIGGNGSGGVIIIEDFGDLAE